MRMSPGRRPWMGLRPPITGWSASYRAGSQACGVFVRLTRDSVEDSLRRLVATAPTNARAAVTVASAQPDHPAGSGGQLPAGGAAEPPDESVEPGVLGGNRTEAASSRR